MRKQTKEPLTTKDIVIEILMVIAVVGIVIALFS